ncbi:MAG: type II CAAX endopeptidase family protein, partial [Propionibacteriaceae bacterium]
RVRRRPLTAFLVLVFGISWPLLSVPVLQAHGLLAGPRLPLPVFVLVVTLGVLVPAALAVTYVLDGRPGVLALFRRAVSWRFGLPVWLSLALGVPVLTLVLGLVRGGALGSAAGDVIWGDVLSVVSAILVIHLSEELVWAGFLQRRLGQRHRLAVAAGLTAVPFAALHLPLSLLGEVSLRSVATDAAGLLVLGVMLRLAVGVALATTGGSVLAAAVLHGSFNASNNNGSLVDDLLSGADHSLLAVLALGLLTLVGWLVSSRSKCHHRL